MDVRCSMNEEMERNEYKMYIKSNGYNINYLIHLFALEYAIRNVKENQFGF
jgi:hypothetical protein